MHQLPSTTAQVSHPCYLSSRAHLLLFKEAANVHDSARTESVAGAAHHVQGALQLPPCPCRV